MFLTNHHDLTFITLFLKPHDVQRTLCGNRPQNLASVDVVEIEKENVALMLAFDSVDGERSWTEDRAQHHATTADFPLNENHRCLKKETESSCTEKQEMRCSSSGGLLAAISKRK